MNRDKKVLVLGMARSGYEAAKFLAGIGYEVLVNDANAKQNTEQINELQALGVKIILENHPEDLIDSTFEMIVKNPGISNDHMYIEKARKNNVLVINEMELAFYYFPPGVKIIGVTGTNGKTTTTTMIYEFLKKASKQVFLMGNIGYPVCSFLPQLKEGDIAVIEVSDHQLCNVVDFKTDISVLTNLSEAHLDFHGSYEIYKSMKQRIFNHHTENDIAILNLDDKEVLELTSNIGSTKKYFTSGSLNKSGCFIDEGYICYNGDKIIALDEVKIKGRHNHENAMAAIAVVKELGVNNNIIATVLRNFGGVEHRMEYVKTINNIDFYNDSKATNITATQTALASFRKPTILLLGGLDRGHSFVEMKDYLINVKLVVAFGEAKRRISDFVMECGIPCRVVDTVEEAVAVAYNASSGGEVVLFSPACASWDQFKDFEVRGKVFKDCVSRLY